MSTLLFQNSTGFELNDGWRVSSVLVGVDDPRRGMVLPAQGFGQKALGRRCIAFGREKEVDRRTAGPSFAVSNQKRESERFLALNTRHLRREKLVSGVWDNLRSFQRALDLAFSG